MKAVASAKGAIRKHIRRMHTAGHGRFSTGATSYFASGWAFFIPYLLIYLLYAWLEWPVNPVGSGQWAVDGNDWSVVPSLLHVYWVLHAIHLALAVVALSSWWQNQKTSPTVRQSDSPTAGPSSVAGSAPSAFSLQLSALWPVVPWLLLAAIFAIPGIYLEWPSDPWEHLRRINEWHDHDVVVAHSTWAKSSYFLPFSLTGHITGSHQLRWLNVYYTSASLLLCWQYYRLARAVGLSGRASFAFVVLNALTFGNHIFSFYRYYGLSSSILAQLGAVALTRIALEALSRHTQHRRSDTGLSPAAFRSIATVPWRLLGAGLVLFPLIALNHVQGIVIAGLSCLAITIWRLIEWKRTIIVWLFLGALSASAATIALVPHPPELDEVFRSSGWLTAWYAFNIFEFTSPAFERSLQILGVFGLLNLLGGLWLILRRNDVIGWLVTMPVLALTLPCFSLLFAHVLLAQHSAHEIITFHRTLFSIPMGLALVAIFSRLPPACRSKPNDVLVSTVPRFANSLQNRPRYHLRVILAISGLLLALTHSPGPFSYSRLWHSLHITPGDLQLQHEVSAWTSHLHAIATDNSTAVHTTLPISSIMEAFRSSSSQGKFRTTHAPINQSDIARRISRLDASVTSAMSSYTPQGFRDVDSYNIALIIENEIEQRLPTIHKPLSLADAAWITLSDSAFLTTHSTDRSIVQNLRGAAADVFCADLIPISSDRRYRLTSTIRQTDGPASVNYLAVAWYNQDKRLLQSNQLQPEGAGSPVGWANGTYSYYGLVGQPAPTRWTQYTISFGRGQLVDVPAHANFARVGALLNYRADSVAHVQLTDVEIQEDPPRQYLIWLPSFRNLHTPASLAARLSHHWPASRVSVVHAGTQELRNRVPLTAR